MFLWSSQKIKFMTGCLPQYYWERWIIFLSTPFHWFIVQRFFVQCVGVLVCFFVVEVLWVFCLRFCCLVVSFLMLGLISILSLGFCCEFWFIWVFCFIWLGLIFDFLNTLCLVPQMKHGELILNFFFLFDDFHQPKDMWKVPAVPVPENWKEILKLIWPCFVDTVIWRAC